MNAVVNNSAIPPRPVVTHEIKLSAALELIDQQDLGSVSAEDIAKHGGQHTDGYELAKDLESYCRWSIDMEMAEALDGYSCCVRSKLRQAEEEWCKAFDIQPPYPIGAAVICKARKRSGFITGVCEHSAAQYEVRPLVPKDDEPESMRWICDFENVTPVDSDTAPTESDAKQ